jgi:hypothetical protein
MRGRRHLRKKNQRQSRVLDLGDAEMNLAHKLPGIEAKGDIPKGIILHLKGFNFGMFLIKNYLLNWKKSP